MMEAEELVLSEVHVTCCPPGQRAWTTTYRLPDTAITTQDVSVGQGAAAGVDSSSQLVDEEGDLIVRRRISKGAGHCLVIHHQLATPLKTVGLQIWRGALLLADFVLSQPALFRGVTALELGAGAGLAGLVLATMARRVFLTDMGADVLENCQANVEANCHLFQQGPAVAPVRALDWTQGWPPTNTASSSCTSAGGSSTGCSSSYDWTPRDLQELSGLQVLLGADTVYDNDLTEAFVQTARQLLLAGSAGGCQPVMYVALEKRFNFTLRDMDARAHAFEYFVRLVSSDSSRQQPAAGTEQVAGLSAERIQPATIPQVLKYERSEDLELWKIKLARD
ncbi:hypothetical protein WJX72_001243 [[Myrmecia] bisecta]|uniref:Methyltransferase-like protein 22 n=1 Tax=[Myrmecia] bisecta TaxID=41462 RepID=A0AAW1Q0H4_9CHLO